MQEKYPQIIYGDRVNSFKHFCFLSEEFEIKRCIKCNKLFWEYLGSDYDRGFVCNECENKFKEESFNVGKGNSYNIEKKEEFGIPRKGCLITDTNIMAN